MLDRELLARIEAVLSRAIVRWCASGSDGMRSHGEEAQGVLLDLKAGIARYDTLATLWSAAQMPAAPPSPPPPTEPSGQESGR